MAPPKPNNPSSKEIIEEAVNLAHLQLTTAIQDTEMQMDERFQAAALDLAQQLGDIHSRFDKEKHIADVRHESVMENLQLLLAQRVFPDPATSHVAATVPVTVHSVGTVHPDGTVHSASGSSGISHTPYSIPMLTQPIPHTITPTFTPPRNSATFSNTHPHHTTTIPPRISAAQPPPPFPPNHSTSTPFIPTQNYNTAFTPYTPHIPFHSNTQIPPLPTARSPKLELPMFDGSNPLDWLFQADQFFSFYNLPPENRLSLISFYMKGDALSWFKWMHHNHLLSDWFSFIRALELRFGPSTFDNHQAELFKLKQEGTVMEYQTKFEKLGNQVVGLSQEALLNCFISGLNPEIQHELAIHKPTYISQAIGLAKLIESKFKEAKQKHNKPYNYQFSKPNTISSFQPTHKPPIPLTTPTNTTAKNSTTPPPNRLPIRRLNNSQLQERRAQGLCFNCDEKFIPGHKCASKFFLLLAEDDITEYEQLAEISSDTELPTTDPSHTYFQLSPQALTGQFSPQTLKFQGVINGLPVMVLVDTGSTHNILQPRLAQHLNLPTSSIPQFSVMVGNGSHLNCKGICQDVPIILQNQQFSLPFYLLPIEGADVVLGMAWLRTLGPINADFSVPSITFSHNNTTITLKGDPQIHPAISSFHQFCQLIHTDSIASLHLMTFEEIQPSTAPTPKSALDTLPTSLPLEVRSIIEHHKEIFQAPQGLPPPRPHDHHIPLFPNTPPVNVKPYRYPHYQKEAMTTIIKDMLKDGIIIPSHSPFSSPVLLVKKKDGTWRFCVDYRALNAVTIKDRFPIPTIDELLDELGNAKIFTKIDLRSGYHQIRVSMEDTYKTAFRTFDGHYEFLVMPFGLTNAPSTFQSAMNDLLRPYLRQFVLVFFDDILIYSPTFADHLTHLHIVFNLLKSHVFVAKLSKCVFAVDRVHYLGHIISAGNVAPDPEKIQAILDWPEPRSLTALRGFLGLTGFYRRFVRNYATLAAPLTDILRSTRFVWGTEAAEAFTQLKTKMTDMPVLVLPDFTKQFVVETDASGVAIGAVLSQDNHPIAFFSKKMCPRMQAASVYVREMYAVTEAVKKWRQYLVGQKFHIHTDQKSLRNLLLQKIQTPEQQKWAAKLQGFNFEIMYKPGKSNLVADALSRKFSEDPLLMVISSPVPELLSTLKAFYSTDPAGKDLVRQMTQQHNDQENFTFIQGLIYHKDRIFIPDLAELRNTILHEYHSTPTAGHSGVKATMARISASFSWPGLYLAVKEMVKHCTVCQHNKYVTQKKKGLLQPLPIPGKVWDELTMDFITHLPNSFGHTVIWVICDRLTKFVHFLALPTKFTAKDLASRFSVEIYRLHGNPKSIVSDRDSLFLSSFWKEFFKQQGTILKYSTSYHPETDGQTEVVNRSLETYLRCFTSDHPRQWYKFLYLAEFWFNTSFHTAIQMTPFKALYGRDPPNPLHYVTEDHQEDSLSTSLQQRQQILHQLKENLKKSRTQMEKQANKKRLDVSFNQGDMVLLKLHPYRQQTVTKRTSQKLSKRFFGPFQIIKRVGEVAYLLDLPSSSRIHPVVHVSLLKPYHGSLSTTEIRPIPPQEQRHIYGDIQNLQENEPLIPLSLVDRKREEGGPKENTSAEKELREEKNSVGQTQERVASASEKGSTNDFNTSWISVPSTINNAPQLAGAHTSPFTCPTRSSAIPKLPLELSNPAIFHPQISNTTLKTLSPRSKNPVSPCPLSPANQSKTSIQISPLSSPPNLSFTPPPNPNYPAAMPASATCPFSLPLKPNTTNPETGPIASQTGPNNSPMNLEDKVLIGPMSIDKKTIRPIRNKTKSVLLKDFYY
ncbi:uncharacterized protein LOC131642924 [Vicia villosa]|uniref:uncharacterized protein LOC131642924 n=1 Tax=Vicia villosa TaxID=3911 RepID=UPI00273BA7DE|nr:uncharacterized protein LOC131642924 [Vicia villosa]